MIRMRPWRAQPSSKRAARALERVRTVDFADPLRFAPRAASRSTRPRSAGPREVRVPRWTSRVAPGLGRRAPRWLGLTVGRGRFCLEAAPRAPERPRSESGSAAGEGSATPDDAGADGG
jgi:hypothetical protein